MGRRRGGGDCYEVAGGLVLEDPRYTLVHGEPLGTGGEVAGVRFGHAWVEFEAGGVWFVLDQSNGGDHLLPRDLYYAIGHVDNRPTRRYTREEARLVILQQGHWGPWGPEPTE